MDEAGDLGEIDGADCGEQSDGTEAADDDDDDEVGIRVRVRARVRVRFWLF